MSFELHAEKSVRSNLRRLVRKQLEKSEGSLQNFSHESRDEIVHDLRKRLKKIRALVRLVRSEIGEHTYHDVNYRFRDAARPLTEVRDAKILLQTFDRLLQHFHEHLPPRGFRQLREALEQNLRDVRRRVLVQQKTLRKIARFVKHERRELMPWLEASNHWFALRCGLEDAYRRAADAFQDAGRDPTVEKLHEWRKQTKYLHYQLVTIRPLWPERIDELVKETGSLGDLLGDNHDLAVLQQKLTDAQPSFSTQEDRDVLCPLCEQRREAFLRESLSLGERFFQEQPAAFVRRLKTCWKAWRRESAAS
jgi:CHAD domain-containing protein